MDENKYIADIMLGKLAKWLRVLGYDCSYYNNIHKSDLIKKSLSDKRIILTRNTTLKNKQVPKVIFITSNNWENQLKEVLSTSKINTDAIFSRCLLCNEKIEQVDKEQVKGNVPDYVFKTSKKFSYCKKCNKYYWDGTHLEEAKKIISKF